MGMEIAGNLSLKAMNDEEPKPASGVNWAGPQVLECMCAAVRTCWAIQVMRK